jgi:hypothetical protein
MSRDTPSPNLILDPATGGAAAYMDARHDIDDLMA